MAEITMKNDMLVCRINKKRQFHAEGMPAIEYKNGTKCWYINGKRHRADGPAIEYPDGSEVWMFNGLRHRGGGPAMIVNGKVRWFIFGVEYTGEQFISVAKLPKEQVCYLKLTFDI